MSQQPDQKVRPTPGGNATGAALSTVVQLPTDRGWRASANNTTRNRHQKLLTENSADIMQVSTSKRPDNQWFNGTRV